MDTVERAREDGLTNLSFSLTVRSEALLVHTISYSLVHTLAETLRREYPTQQPHVLHDDADYMTLNEPRSRLCRSHGSHPAKWATYEVYL